MKHKFITRIMIISFVLIASCGMLFADGMEIDMLQTYDIDANGNIVFDASILPDMPDLICLIQAANDRNNDAVRNVSNPRYMHSRFSCSKSDAKLLKNTATVLDEIGKRATANIAKTIGVKLDWKAQSKKPGRIQEVLSMTKKAIDEVKSGKFTKGNVAAVTSIFGTTVGNANNVIHTTRGDRILFDILINGTDSLKDIVQEGSLIEGVSDLYSYAALVSEFVSNFFGSGTDYKPYIESYANIPANSLSIFSLKDVDLDQLDQ